MPYVYDSVFGTTPPLLCSCGGHLRHKSSQYSTIPDVHEHFFHMSPYITTFHHASTHTCKQHILIRTAPLPANQSSAIHRKYVAILLPVIYKHALLYQEQRGTAILPCFPPSYSKSLRIETNGAPDFAYGMCFTPCTEHAVTTRCALQTSLQKHHT